MILVSRILHADHVGDADGGSLVHFNSSHTVRATCMLSPVPGCTSFCPAPMGSEMLCADSPSIVCATHQTSIRETREREARRVRVRANLGPELSFGHSSTKISRNVVQEKRLKKPPKLEQREFVFGIFGIMSANPRLPARIERTRSRNTHEVACNIFRSVKDATF